MRCDEVLMFFIEMMTIIDRSWCCCDYFLSLCFFGVWDLALLRILFWWWCFFIALLLVWSFAFCLSSSSFTCSPFEFLIFFHHAFVFTKARSTEANKQANKIERKRSPSKLIRATSLLIYEVHNSTKVFDEK